MTNLEQLVLQRITGENTAKIKYILSTTFEDAYGGIRNLPGMSQRKEAKHLLPPGEGFQELCNMLQEGTKRAPAPPEKKGFSSSLYNEAKISINIKFDA